MAIRIKIVKKTEDELDREALEQDLFLYSYIERVEKGLLTKKEKEQRQAFFASIGFSGK